MTENLFPPLPLADWQPSRDTIQGYAQVLGKIRRATTPRQKHWWHISLRVSATGLVTSPIPAGSRMFEMRLDFTSHQLIIATSRGEIWHKPLRGESEAEFWQKTLAVLGQMGLRPEIDRTLFSDTTPGTYNVNGVERFWQALSQINALFTQFKGELRQETSPVQFWPHHFDLSLVWFSGRLVPDVDPADEEHADEQMAFGFSTGDTVIPDPYFYITAYPLPDGLLESPLPEEATWHTEGFQGAVLRYDSLVKADNPAEKLLNFLRTVQQAGASLMK